MLGYANEEIRSGDPMLWEGSRNAAVVGVVGLSARFFEGYDFVKSRQGRRHKLQMHLELCEIPVAGARPSTSSG